MIHVRTPRQRIATAVTVALTVTLGTLTAAPAVATTPVVATATQAARQDAVTLPADARVFGNGPSGFLTRASGAGAWVYRWTRYADGVTTTLPAGTYTGSVRSDVVVRSEGGTHTLYDMATGADPVVIDTAFLGASARFVRLAGSTLVMEVPRADGGSDVHLVGRPGGSLVDRKVTGLPANTTYRWYDLSAPDTMIFHYKSAESAAVRVALVDIATATVVEDRVLTGAVQGSDASASATHLAWVERDATGSAALQVARRGQTATSRIPLGSGESVAVELMGDWVTYGVTGGAAATAPNPLHTLTARSLTDGRTVELLDVVDRVRADGDGALLVQGGTVEHGQGLYRIAPGADGTPSATLVASTGEPLALDVVEQHVPSTVDFSTHSGDVDLRWRLNHSRPVTSYVELTHTASGKRWTSYSSLVSTYAGATWKGLFGDYTAAYNGAYTWRLTVKPANGIGPDLVRTGGLTVASKPHPHDFSDSGSPDLLYRHGGRLLAVDARRALYFGHYATPLEMTVIGTGWDAYDQIVTPGNVAGAAFADVVARDRSGALWLHTGTGKNAFAARTKIGGGWQIYNRITGGSDLDGDGRPDLVATDKAGELWFYKGTGNASAPFAARVKTGHGWGVYNKIVATGQIGGGPAGDLVARDTAGVLWLYLGKGDGTFAPRTRIGGGWDRYAEIVAIGDADRDGRPDLLANGHTGGTHDSLALYRGTGTWSAPFSGRDGIYTPYDLTRMSVTLF
ncbi:FG-GAP repeat domain-containing protein [Streptomyces zaomyceticus]|uniref:FG-GAP repeat domain-containing protein n=1 Tax=Streptomyces zaomyceticus TaxID=68286 RepID=UPI003442084A